LRRKSARRAQGLNEPTRQLGAEDGLETLACGRPWLGLKNEAVAEEEVGAAWLARGGCFVVRGFGIHPIQLSALPEWSLIPEGEVVP